MHQQTRRPAPPAARLAWRLRHAAGLAAVCGGVVASALASAPVQAQVQAQVPAQVPVPAQTPAVVTPLPAVPPAAAGAPVAAGQAAAGQAAAGQAATWDIDPAASRVWVFVGKTGLGHNHAVVGMLQAGRIVLGAGEQAGMIVFDMRSFQADTTEARKALGLPGETDAWTQQQVTTNMTGADVLDVARHPTATFQIRSALASQRQVNGRPPVYELIGGFTLRGVTREVMIPVEAEQRGEWLRLRGSFTIKQTDFGMKPYAKLGGVVGVADELRITGDVLVRAPAPNANAGGGAARSPAGPTVPGAAR